MRMSTWMNLAIPALLSTQLMAGVVYEVETTDHGQSPADASSSEIAIEGSLLKMEVAPGESSQAEGNMIWRGDRREMVIIDHEDKSYMVMDEETKKAVADRVGQASAQMAEALKNVPEDQRAMVEKMMQERMPQQMRKRPVVEISKTADSKDINGYPCVKYVMSIDGRESRRMWVTEWENLEGGDDASAAFIEMSGFFSEMMESVGQAAHGMGGGESASGGFAQLRELNGFPVVSEELADDGSVLSRSELRSTERRSFDPADFEPPAGYKRRSMMPQ